MSRAVALALTVAFVLPRAVLLAAFALLAAVPAGAQGVPCGLAGPVHLALERQYDEGRRFAGLAPAGVVEMWTGADGRWALVLSLPDGRTCLMFVGEAAAVLGPAVPGAPG